MLLVCSSCARTLEYSGDRPRFCSSCGSAIPPASVTDVVTKELPAPSEERTVPPTDEWATHNQTAAAQAWATVDTPTAEFTPRGPGVPESVGGYRLLKRLGGGGEGA